MLTISTANNYLTENSKSQKSNPSTHPLTITELETKKSTLLITTKLAKQKMPVLNLHTDEKPGENSNPSNHQPDNIKVKSKDAATNTIKYIKTPGSGNILVQASKVVDNLNDMHTVVKGVKTGKTVASATGVLLRTTKTGIEAGKLGFDSISAGKTGNDMVKEVSDVKKTVVSPTVPASAGGLEKGLAVAGAALSIYDTYNTFKDPNSTKADKVEKVVTAIGDSTTAVATFTGGALLSKGVPVIGAFVSTFQAGKSFMDPKQGNDDRIFKSLIAVSDSVVAYAGPTPVGMVALSFSTGMKVGGFIDKQFDISGKAAYFAYDHLPEWMGGKPKDL